MAFPALFAPHKAMPGPPILPFQGILQKSFSHAEIPTPFSPNPKKVMT